MKLDTELQRIMDLEEPFDEAVKKLCGTTVILNGKSFFLQTIEKDRGTVTGSFGSGKITREKVESLDVFLPETGVYPLKKGAYVLITKNPIRQWLKSFSNSFYSWKFFGKPEYGGWLTDLIANRDKRMDLWVDSDNQIFYLDAHIGYISKQKIVCLDLRYKQELLDWSRDGLHNFT